MIDIALSDELSIHHYKNLRHPLQDYKRVHIKNHVLLFRFKDNAITFESFEHHDTVYDKE
jgi:mRNA-degrading endonuclease RelE of RelBE toxin-antitoxin system